MPLTTRPSLTSKHGMILFDHSIPSQNASVFAAFPTIAACTFNASSCSMSSLFLIPPEAITGIDVDWTNLPVNSKFGPDNLPSFEISV